jgi:U4/U6.U5 tri-snRNP-associated protein 3
MDSVESKKRKTNEDDDDHHEGSRKSRSPTRSLNQTHDRSPSPSPPSDYRHHSRHGHEDEKEDRSRSTKKSSNPGRKRSPSPSPPSDYRHHSNRSADGLDEKKGYAIERKARMERLRAENEAEEKAALVSQESGGGGQASHTETAIKYTEEDLEGLDEDEQMNLLMGFSGGFGSTQNESVEDNHSSAAVGAVAKNKARKYRQYMNRKGGFNRPLEKMS